MNRLVLDATLAQRDPLRYTPAGIPAIDCTLHHASMQAEAGGERRVECEIHAVAFAATALALSRMSVGGALRCEGFLARRYRTGVTVAMHVTNITNIEHTEGN
ncbi:MAG: primosomal replication protein N [Burkholderiales bacterium]